MQTLDTPQTPDGAPIHLALDERTAFALSWIVSRHLWGLRNRPATQISDELRGMVEYLRDLLPNRLRDLVPPPDSRHSAENG